MDDYTYLLDDYTYLLYLKNLIHAPGAIDTTIYKLKT